MDLIAKYWRTHESQSGVELDLCKHIRRAHMYYVSD